jgi:hypothetical protein
MFYGFFCTAILKLLLPKYRVQIECGNRREILLVCTRSMFFAELHLKVQKTVRRSAAITQSKQLCAASDS